MEVVGIEFGRIIAPDHRRNRQEAPKRILATPAAFLRLSIGFCSAWGFGAVFMFQMIHYS